MQLRAALRIERNMRVAFVGAGGKTSTLFQLVRELGKPAIATATTHMARYQLALADTHLTLGTYELPEDLQTDEFIFITGERGGEGRLNGLSGTQMESLASFVGANEIPLLIEADGSRQKPLKAPAEYEPVIPDWIDTVVVCAGLEGLGKPLTDEWVHRPQIFSSLSGLNLGAAISIEAIERMLTHPQGGLKNIPPGACKVALLTQVNTTDRLAQAEQSIPDLLKAYDIVVLASSQMMSAARPGEPIFSLTVLGAFEQTAGVILAAGESRRLGTPKALLSWRGKPFVRQIAETALNAGLRPVVVVLGAVLDPIISLLEDLPIQIVVNENWSQGQSSSIHTGLHVLPKKVGSAVFLLADQPQVTTEVIRALAARHDRTRAAIVAPYVGGKRTNPVLFDHDTFTDLMQLTGDTGGRGIFNDYQIEIMYWDDDSLLMDVDTQQDYLNLKRIE